MSKSLAAPAAAILGVNLCTRFVIIVMANATTTQLADALIQPSVTSGAALSISRIKPERHMTETEKKALALVNEVLAEWGVLKNAVEVPKNSDAFACALLRAIEQHEAYKQEVSDAVEEIAKAWGTADPAWGYLRRFIIPKPDPLVEVIADYKRTKGTGEYATNKDMAAALRAALDARGLEIREKQP
jgi:hypothetical protein